MEEEQSRSLCGEERRAVGKSAGADAAGSQAKPRGILRGVAESGAQGRPTEQFRKIDLIPVSLDVGV